MSGGSGEEGGRERQVERSDRVGRERGERGGEKEINEIKGERERSEREKSEG